MYSFCSTLKKISLKYSFWYVLSDKQNEVSVILHFGMALLAASYLYQYIRYTLKYHSIYQ